MSAFHAVMEYAREHLPGIAADIDYDTSKSLRSRQSVMNAVAEVMRRINYVPDAASLPEGKGGWRMTLTSNRMLNPASAATLYKRFVADMNDDMVNSFRHALECRVAREKGLPEPAPPVRHGLDDDEWEMRETANPPAAAKIKPRRSSDEEVNAVVGRLLEQTPLNDENWGAW
ncbi:hypothetical protein AB6809_29420 [Paraburkholderia sp. RCC_158]|uniref:hypothetical protein n=1 Tax=Paraburkholderia sp. RCC_158 TaxID=3239220 RepID=UPI0035242289